MPIGLDVTPPEPMPPTLVSVKVFVVVPMVSNSLAVLLVGLASMNAPLGLDVTVLVTLPAPLPAMMSAVI